MISSIQHAVLTPSRHSGFFRAAKERPDVFCHGPALRCRPQSLPQDRKISDRAGSFSEQSASFPGRRVSERFSSGQLSRLARSCSVWKRGDIYQSLSGLPDAHQRNAREVCACRSIYKPLISLFPNFVLVCPSNCGSSSFTETTAVIPSRTSSPERIHYL